MKKSRFSEEQIIATLTNWSDVIAFIRDGRNFIPVDQTVILFGKVRGEGLKDLR